MNTNDMHDKTSTGQKEINENAAGLSMMERRVLILINGENDVETLAKLSLCDNIEAVIDRLLELEMVEVTEPTIIQAEAANDTHEPANETDASEVNAREFMCNTLSTFGNKVRIAPLHKQIEETTDIEGLRQLISPWYQSISETPGGMYQADDLREEVLGMLQREGVNAA